MTRELGVFRCPSCAEHPEDWYAWAASEGKPWPEGHPVAEWVEVLPALDKDVLCICCGLPTQLIEPLGIAAPRRTAQ